MIYYIAAYVCASFLIGFATMVHEIRNKQNKDNVMQGFMWMSIGWPIFLPIFTLGWLGNQIYKLAERVA